MRNRLLALLLIALLLLPCLCACAETQEENPKETVSEGESEYDPFEAVDYGGSEFWIYTSVNAASTGMGNSNFMIEGEEQADSSDIVASAVYKRNLDTEELLGINLEYVHSDLIYTAVSDDIKKFVTSAYRV